ncbi:Golgi transport complex subunit 3 [Ascosphaera acerosa]|nr:Golgi transport complex subunit 3 [Ascosphaera acerosa]
MHAHDGAAGSIAQLSNEADYARWYTHVRDGLLTATLAEHQSYLDELQASTSYLDAVLSDTTDILGLLSSLRRSFEDVDEQTQAFKKQCETYLSAQARSSALADDIHDNLRYYDFLEPASKRLNAPGAGGTVRSKEFSDMLARIDECLEYMQAHTDHKDAEAYRSQYKMLMTRALTLVRTEFVAKLRKISADVAGRIASRQLNDTTMSAVLYAKFRVDAADMAQIGLEIQKRAVIPIDAAPDAEPEYQSLLGELHAAFASARGGIIIPLIRQKLYTISQTPSTSKDLVSFARASISYIRGICLDEFDLWGEWFHGQQGLYQYLESICEPLFDHLRPMILHETKLVNLCQLCTLLQTRYLSDAEDDGGEPSESSPVTVQLDFSVLIQPALEDAQARLVFRTQSILRTGIERFKPQPEDIDYPAHNKQISFSQALRIPAGAGGEVSSFSPSSGTASDAKESDSTEESGAAAILAGWYPTLRTAVWLLSRMYRLVNSVVFDDLAHQIVHQTTISLQAASTLIAAKASAADGWLFLIKHLLLLKQQIVAFDIEFVSAPDVSVDFFSAITGTFYELRERGGLFNPRNIMRLVGQGLMPTVIENMLDAKAELDGQLRNAINTFTDDFATRMTKSLSITPTMTPASDSSDGDEDTRLRQILHETRQVIQAEVTDLRAILDDYLDDRRTCDTLIGAVQDLVVQRYEEFVEAAAISLMESKHAAALNMKPSSVQAKTASRAATEQVVALGLWDVDMFADWCDAIFRVDSEGVLSQSPRPSSQYVNE